MFFLNDISLITLHGLPAANTPAGMLFETTLPAPITVLSPMTTPGNIVTFVVIQTLFPIIIGWAITVEKSFKSWVEVTIIFLYENEQLSPIITGAKAKINVSANPTLFPTCIIGAEQ